ncbi:hypothetical protein LEP1GSC170_1303 [Leptospira interrogans serovar Bataviae str. HAI135]|nr:hypothetical protein LEP1GSC170_1303 [Leptospira interrogans serovar Bataviae str. HAI135]
MCRIFYLPFEFLFSSSNSRIRFSSWDIKALYFVFIFHILIVNRSISKLT